jgi:outer membrane protein TolC
VDSLTALALAQRPELALARDGEQSAELRRHLAALDRRPSLDLNLGLGAKNGYVPNLNEVKGNFVAALSLELPVFNGFRTRSEVEETEAELGAARAQTRDVIRRVVTEVQQAAANVRASRAKLEAAELQVRQAEEAVALARVRYRAGVITNLDVLDAETSLAEAKLVELEARYHVVTTHYALQREVGARIW